jgi:hypothetical protein
VEGVVEKDFDKSIGFLERAYVHGSEDAERVLRQFGLLE